MGPFKIGMSAQYLKIPLLDNIKCRALVSLMILEIIRSKVKDQTEHKKIMSTQYFENRLLDRTQHTLLFHMKIFRSKVKSQGSNLSGHKKVIVRSISFEHFT